MIRSAIVPVADHGARLLPATKSQPKEMLPVARKPIVHYVAKELIANRIDQILFVTGRNLGATNKEELLAKLEFTNHEAHFFYTPQRLQRELGDAVLCGEDFAAASPSWSRSVIPSSASTPNPERSCK